MLLTMLAVSVLVFVVLEVSPGSVATKVLGPYSSPAQRQLWLAQHGYTAPLTTRYLTWLRRVLVGDFGYSSRFKVPVHAILWPRLANTAWLGLTTFAVLVPLSLTLGVLAGMRAGSLHDRLISLLSILTTSVPEFASAVLLSAIFVFGLAWLPGTSAMADGWAWQELVLPTAVLVLYDFGYVARMTRAAMVEVMHTDYIRTAVLKGLPWHVVILKHALRNALMTPLTVLMLQMNWLLSGVIVVEFFFAYKGFGALLLEASLNQDIYLIEACTLVAVCMAVLTQTLADVGYAYLNPRLRYAA
jgi:peptide/nickel transport system permease protein